MHIDFLRMGAFRHIEDGVICFMAALRGLASILLLPITQPRIQTYASNSNNRYAYAWNMGYGSGGASVKIDTTLERLFFSLGRSGFCFASFAFCFYTYGVVVCLIFKFVSIDFAGRIESADSVTLLYSA